MTALADNPATRRWLEICSDPAFADCPERFEAMPPANSSCPPPPGCGGGGYGGKRLAKNAVDEALGRAHENHVDGPHQQKRINPTDPIERL
jgi:hypothetical protein